MGSAVKSITKPVAKVLDKIVPNEIKPILPFAAAIAAPYLGPSIGGLGGLVTNATLRGAIGGGLLNLAGQLPQEGYERRGPNLASLGLASLAGGIGGAAGAPTGAPGGIENLRAGMTIGTTPSGAAITAGDFANFQTLNPGVESVGNIGYSTNLSALQGAENLIRSGVASAAEYAKPGLEAGKRIFTGTGELKDIIPAAKTLAPSVIGAATETADRFARDALDEYNRQQAALGQTVAQNKADQIFYIRQAMQQAGFNEDEIGGAIAKFGFADGGRVGYSKGGGLMNLKMGGMPVEMDLRAKGGFVPIGKKERADDVPARLSKNEFVFTAKAVRNAGGGDIREGAKRMYNLMNRLEAKR
jgi:alkylhydroperoxidase/carboxymuconolactone decarboxylase family protein YurZ